MSPGTPKKEHFECGRKKTGLIGIKSAYFVQWS